MSCPIALQSRLKGGFQTGGGWKYNGFESLTTYDFNKDNLDQFGAGGGGGEYTFPSPGSAVSGGDNPSIDFSGAAQGVYSFTYTVGDAPCDFPTNIAVVVKTPPCAGKSKTFYLCSETESFNVLEALVEDMDSCTPLSPGTFTTNMPNFNPETGIISPLVPGDFTVDYAASVDPTALLLEGADIACPNCTQLSTIRLVIADASATQRVKADYWVDMSWRSLTQPDLDGFLITSFIYNGNELLSAPVGFGTENVETFGTATNYLTNLVDALNTINVPYTIFTYSEEEECSPYHSSARWKYINIDWRALDYFQFTIQKSGNNFMRFTQLKSEMWNGSAWVLAQNSVAGTFYACGNTRINVVSYLGC